MSLDIKLPAEFSQRMIELLKEEYEVFLQSFKEKHFSGLRVNQLKLDVEQFFKISPFALEPVPWATEGFYYQEGDRPGKHPYYSAGLYYLQEPSAMAPVSILNPQPGDRVLDLCAAPGGKSTQIAAKLQGKGLLVSNDIKAERIVPLIKNLEVFGVKNCIVTNDNPAQLAKKLPEFFDKILIDAPCSGEGMFRKNPTAIKSWEDYGIQVCTAMQEDILKEVAVMLKPGGQILYSTCTFSPEENEGQIAHFLSSNQDFFLREIELVGGIESGRDQWVKDGTAELRKTARLWPHRVRGEGHFLALLEKRSGKHNTKTEIDLISPKKSGSLEKEGLEALAAFWSQYLKIPLPDRIVSFKNHLYQLPQDLPDLSGIKVMRFGWYLGELKKKRFEPSQAMAMALTREEFAQSVNFQAQDQQVIRYLKGETIEGVENQAGWTAVCVDGFPLGWAKAQGTILKNHYFKGWRWQS